ncbi:adenosylcobinamide kinase /adenosylcobinamide-phosphate guanylyltransferase [Jatrophihabitans sp. GAS493]|uniref:bifunctional adenosylcobinamide kinase/adenosylcobinamide-phosphate guanylyltransferase n=1 Tax=Jatrophihabitans sp. GAS493 TaxID=1907575 RepID=UPI000BB7B0EA|nr:bifunctional adenosylcobinamide kinase/adenosylcobinamide-phosphate guanylyltransferase [Jatrophihabitans sp. GAS493]SOD74486.1 adenosylcobinamide kinase /adenosylcobinamide-phosphate guanylyltransferase [Jatrophihabitans sp. GAS493]
MSVRNLSVGRSFGVLVDDPVAGRILLDCGEGVAASAALAGVSLANIDVLLVTGYDLQHVDPAIVQTTLFEARIGALGLATGARPPRAARPIRIEDGSLAWLVSLSTGALLHHTSSARVTADDLSLLPSELTVSFPLEGPVAEQLRRFTIRELPTNQRVLITGGARSGKSRLAEQRLLARHEVLYVAAGPVPSADDVEWRERVRLHQQRRPSTWRTVETTDVAAVLREPGSVPVLLDCLGTWLTATMDRIGFWDGSGEATEALAEQIEALLRAWSMTERDVVAVTNEVGSGVVPATAAGRRFRDELGRLNAAVAAASDEVWLATVGIGQRLK